MNMPKFYSVQQVAAMVDMSTDYIYEELRRGRLQAYKFGKNYKIELQMLEAWIESKKVEPAHAQGRRQPTPSAREQNRERRGDSPHRAGAAGVSP